MSDVLVDGSSSTLTRANERNLVETWRLLMHHWVDADLVDRPDEFRFVTSVPSPVTNAILWVRFSPEEADVRISRIVDDYRVRGLPFLWWVTPSVKPPDLGKHLAAKGLHRLASGPGMSANLKQVPEESRLGQNVTVKRVSSIKDVNEWKSVLARSSEFPRHAVLKMADATCRDGLGIESNLHHFVAHWRANPVAAASVSYAAGVAGIYHVAVSAEARGRGVGSAITLAALRHARDQGFQFAVLQSAAQSAGMYRRLGFVEDFGIDIYQSPSWWRPILLVNRVRHRLQHRPTH